MSTSASDETIVVTGIGCITPLGNDAKTFWQNLVAGKTGISEITKLDTTGLRNTRGGEIKNFDWSQYGDDGDCDEASQFAFAAAREAILDAGLSDEVLREIGVVFSTNFGGAAY